MTCIVWFEGVSICVNVWLIGVIICYNDGVGLKILHIKRCVVLLQSKVRSWEGQKMVAHEAKGKPWNKRFHFLPTKAHSARRGSRRIWARCPEQVNHEQDWKLMADSHEQVWAPGMWGWTKRFREIKWLGWGRWWKHASDKEKRSKRKEQMKDDLAWVNLDLCIWFATFPPDCWSYLPRTCARSPILCGGPSTNGIFSTNLSAKGQILTWEKSHPYRKQNGQHL